jgi:hypothetical protein
VQTVTESSEEENNAKVTSYLDTYDQPQCLRFSPSLSSDKIQISSSGFTAQSGIDKGYAVGNIAFEEGVHFWEFICPISVSNISFGV